MSSKAPDVTDVDIDPGWYPGQTELEEEQEPALEPLLPDDGAAKQYSVTVSWKAAAGPSAIPASVPTVLTKLQKWGDYESVGGQVLPTKFIPMKTPLSGEILDSWSLPSQPKHRLTVPEMVAQQRTLGRKVGLLLDLSNHDCLYAADIPPGLDYRHVQLVAKELPPQEFVDAVVAVANKFWEKHPDEYIAVHCAYGFNRTGFVVCCYLIECCGLSVEDALAAFAVSRPPGVKHEDFRNELYRRYSNFMYGTATYGVFGSPDDNSSFGYSTSCGSLDLGPAGGGSPALGLARGSTFDCLLGPHNSTVAARSSGVSQDVQRRSMDGHQTMTFTMASFAAADFRCGNSGGALKQGVRIQQQQQQHWTQQPALALPHLQIQPHARQGGHVLPHGEHRPRENKTPQEERQVRSQGKLPLQQQEQGQQTADGFVKANGNVLSRQHVFGVRRQDSGCGDVPGSGSTAEPEPSISSMSVATTASAEDRGGSTSRAASQQQLHSCCSADNESLGVNDRAVLLALRQQALAQLSGTTIPEESDSTQSTPGRECSSISLADCDSTAGHCTPRPARPGRYSHKSLDTIDWVAAGGADESGGVVGNGAGVSAPAFEALRLG